MVFGTLKKFTGIDLGLVVVQQESPSSEIVGKLT